MPFFFRKKRTKATKFDKNTAVLACGIDFYRLFSFIDSGFWHFSYTFYYIISQKSF